MGLTPTTVTNCGRHAESEPDRRGKKTIKWFTTVSFRITKVRSYLTLNCSALDGPLFSMMARDATQPHGGSTLPLRFSTFFAVLTSCDLQKHTPNERIPLSNASSRNKAIKEGSAVQFPDLNLYHNEVIP